MPEPTSYGFNTEEMKQAREEQTMDVTEDTKEAREEGTMEIRELMKEAIKTLEEEEATERTDAHYTHSTQWIVAD